MKEYHFIDSEAELQYSARLSKRKRAYMVKEEVFVEEAGDVNGRAGNESEGALGKMWPTIRRVLDMIGAQVMICSLSGRVHHVTPKLARVLKQDPSGEELCSHMRELAAACGRALERNAATLRELTDVSSTVYRTAMAQYGFEVGCIALGGPHQALRIIVALEQLSADWPTETTVRGGLGLTRQEARVALLLAKGRSNEEIAGDLFISPHTARHHTERVLEKTGLHSRSEVATAVLSGLREVGGR